METNLSYGRFFTVKNAIVLAVAALALVMIVGCAAGPNQLVDSPDDSGRVAGFWHGLWHGFIALFAFIVSLFSDNVRIYEVHNSGNSYNFGFLLGVMIFFGGGCGGAGRQSRCRRPVEDDSKE